MNFEEIIEKMEKKINELEENIFEIQDFLNRRTRRAYERERKRPP